MAIRFDLNPLKANKAFHYLGHTITHNNSDWVELYRDLHKSQRRWGRVTKAMGKTGAPIKARATIYKAGFQSVLLYESKIWVVMNAMMTLIEVFHHIIDRRIVGMTARKGDRKEWKWASVYASLDTMGIYLIRGYARRCQDKIAGYVSGRPT